jgi:Nucleoside 2-deoxyribosyltransferase like
VTEGRCASLAPPGVADREGRSEKEIDANCSYRRRLSSVRVIYSDQEPIFDSPSIFLAGPTPRTDQVISWRKQALRILQERGFPGAVLIPERRDWVSSFDYIDQVEWEFTCLEAATVIAFWIPRDLVSLPGFTTNVEFGRYVGSGKLVYGRPDSAPKNRYLDWLCRKLTNESPCRTLEDTLCAAVARAFQLVDGEAAPVEVKPKEIIR